MLKFEEKIKEYCGDSVEFEGAKHYYHMPNLGEISLAELKEFA